MRYLLNWNRKPFSNFTLPGMLHPASRGHYQWVKYRRLKTGKTQEKSIVISINMPDMN